MVRFDSNSIITHVEESPRKVISLVPSVTETLIEFGLAHLIVGVTDYCPVFPDESGIPTRLGGTKSPDLDKIVALKPDLVIANQEENSREAIEFLDEAGILIWLAFPKTVDEAIEDLWVTARIFQQERQLAQRIETLQRSLEWTRLAHGMTPPKRYFCPIWIGENWEWWMTFNQNTYANDILRCCGGHNVFAERERRYPLEADLRLQPPIEVTEQDTRYPRVTPSEVIAAEPEIIFLPSEPYEFKKEDTRKISEILLDTPAVQTNQIFSIDGRLLTWHGIHIAKSLTALPPYFHKNSS
jgi:iron complex transport system substrate-binding protein